MTENINHKPKPITCDMCGDVSGMKTAVLSTGKFCHKCYEAIRAVHYGRYVNLFYPDIDKYLPKSRINFK